MSETIGLGIAILAVLAYSVFLDWRLWKWVRGPHYTQQHRFLRGDRVVIRRKSCEWYGREAIVMEQETGYVEEGCIRVGLLREAGVTLEIPEHELEPTTPEQRGGGDSTNKDDN